MRRYTNECIFGLLVVSIALWFWSAGRHHEEAPSQTPLSNQRPAQTSVPTPGPKAAVASTPVTSSKPTDERLPNLTIQDVVWDAPYIRVIYTNTGSDRVAADFTIDFAGTKGTFGGNSNYRHEVPPSGKTVTSGGVTPGLFLQPKPTDLSPSSPPQNFIVTIDPEDRVRESNERDNTMNCAIKMTPEGVIEVHTEPIKSPPWGDQVSDTRPDLIVTDAQLKGDALEVTISNQGSEGSSATFATQLFLKKKSLGTFSGWSVPPAGGSVKTTLPGLGLKPSDIVEIHLDSAHAVREGRESNNVFLRQLDNSHVL